MLCLGAFGKSLNTLLHHYPPVGPGHLAHIHLVPINTRRSSNDAAEAEIARLSIDKRDIAGAALILQAEAGSVHAECALSSIPRCVGCRAGDRSGSYWERRARGRRASEGRARAVVADGRIGIVHH